VVGDAYVCLDVVRAQAAAHGVPLREELCRVVVHAMLHAVGHTHPEGPGRERSPMWRRQEQLLARATRRA
jgi:probable rRNA maturation factor